MRDISRAILETPIKVQMELLDLNCGWFHANKHLTNQQMLDAGLIDNCDLIWVNLFRKAEKDEAAILLEDGGSGGC